MTFDLSDYVDVSERVRQFYEKYPNGRLVTTLVEQTDSRVTVKAEAFRDAADTFPAGTGLSSLEVPGATPYTKGSELENAETSAVGRAIAFCGFSTQRGIASREEVEARQPDNGNPAVRAQRVYEETVVPNDDGNPANIEIHFGKNAGRTLGDLTSKQVEWYATQWDPDSNPQYPAKPRDKRLKMAAQVLAAGGGAEQMAEAVEADSIPFG